MIFNWGTCDACGEFAFFRVVKSSVSGVQFNVHKSCARAVDERNRLMLLFAELQSQIRNRMITNLRSTDRYITSTLISMDVIHATPERVAYLASILEKIKD